MTYVSLGGSRKSFYKVAKSERKLDNQREKFVGKKTKTNRCQAQLRCLWYLRKTLGIAGEEKIGWGSNTQSDKKDQNKRKKSRGGKERLVGGAEGWAELGVSGSKHRYPYWGKGTLKKKPSSRRQ